MNKNEKKLFDIAFSNAMQAYLHSRALADLLNPEQKKQFAILVEKHAVILAESLLPLLGEERLKEIQQRVLQGYL